MCLLFQPAISFTVSIFWCWQVAFFAAWESPVLVISVKGLLWVPRGPVRMMSEKQFLQQFNRVLTESLLSELSRTHAFAEIWTERNSSWRVHSQIWRDWVEDKWGALVCSMVWLMVSNPVQCAHSKMMVVGSQARSSVTHTDVVHCRSLQLKGQTLMGTCHWCRLGTYQGILTHQIHPPSSATCPVCCTSSVAVTHWNTWSTTHSWPRKSHSHYHSIEIGLNVLLWGATEGQQAKNWNLMRKRSWRDFLRGWTKCHD